MVKWIIGIAATLLFVACGTRTPELAPADSSPAGSGQHSEPEEDFERIEAAALEAFEGCVGDDEGKHFILVFQGLVDFASNNPAESDPSDQKDFRVVLVDAKTPSNVRVLNSNRLNRHRPVFAFRSSLSDLGGDQDWTEIELEDHDVGIRAVSSGTVRMHQEDRDDSRCSLKWAILVDDLVERPRNRLRPDVFDAPPGRLTASRFVVGEGEAFTAAVFGGWEEPCTVRFARTGINRAVASLIAVAVPADGDELTLQVEGPDGEDEWEFRLGGAERAVLIVRNHAMDENRQGYDFAGHLGLRRDMNVPLAQVPTPDFDDCGGEDIRTDNPQCSPANNQWP
jgi:hypothetical protein